MVTPRLFSFSPCFFFNVLPAHIAFESCLDYSITISGFDCIEKWLLLLISLAKTIFCLHLPIPSAARHGFLSKFL